MSAQAIVSAFLPIIGFANGVFMALSPSKAAKKIYKFDPKEVKPQVVELVQANGVSALSLGVLEMLLSFTSLQYHRAVSIAFLPKILFLLSSMVQKSKFGSEMLEPKNLVKIILATLLCEGRFMSPELSLQVRGGLYVFLGSVFTLAPTIAAGRLNNFDAGPVTERCLRARGKMDVVFGVLVLCLATGKPYTEAMGVSCVFWFAVSLYGDFIINARDRFRRDAFAQLLIASVSAGILLKA